MVILDGDDWLASDRALGVLEREYREGWDVVWSTWRGSDGRPGSSDYLSPLISPRLQPFVTSHLFSFRRRLFDALRPRDLQDDEGGWFRAACDLAIAWPILEQTIRRRFVDQVLYVYNRANPLRVGTLGRRPGQNVSEGQSRTAAILRARTPCAAASRPRVRPTAPAVLCEVGAAQRAPRPPLRPHTAPNGPARVAAGGIVRRVRERMAGGQGCRHLIWRVSP